MNGIKLKNYVNIVIPNIKKSHNKYVFLVNIFILLSNIPPKKEDSTKVKSSRHKNAPCWSATSCSPTDLLRSTIGARGLNFWVRNGTRCASPAMVADQQGVFLYHKGFSRALRAAQCDVNSKASKITHQFKNIKEKKSSTD